jgi:hypothetical protein
VYGLTAYCLIQKARGGFSGAGFSLATMKDMPVICPAFLIILRGDCGAPGAAEITSARQRPPMPGATAAETMLGRSDRLVFYFDALSTADKSTQSAQIAMRTGAQFA